ncbi:MAG: hypothetical protein A3H42_00350 [Deltaproteobacteria bacterium RIFCSPLOWO2_02_FULL_46_8]|nr:MAG: hypothetical protein A3H42_00350 [Deltaproteobacteria bacterium RIFCSPLOWO2_02_FULL_46_8]
MSKILVVDDNQDFVRILSQRLESEGFETSAAYEGVRGIEMAHKIKPDLILLDLKMPVGTGQSVLNNLKSHWETEKIPVIVITALNKSDVEEEVMSAGALDIFTKPLNEKLLLVKIHSLLQQPRP